MIQIPVRTIIVRGQDTQGVLIGASVIVNGMNMLRMKADK